MNRKWKRTQACTHTHRYVHIHTDKGTYEKWHIHYWSYIHRQAQTFRASHKKPKILTQWHIMLDTDIQINRRHKERTHTWIKTNRHTLAEARVWTESNIIALTQSNTGTDKHRHTNTKKYTRTYTHRHGHERCTGMLKGTDYMNRGTCIYK